MCQFMTPPISFSPLTCFARILLKSSQRVINHDGYIVGCGAAVFIPNAFRKIAQCFQRSRDQASRLIGKCGDLRLARLKSKQIFQESSLWSRTILNLLIHPQSAIDFSFFFNDRFRPNNKRKISFERRNARLVKTLNSFISLNSFSIGFI